jgi:tryptophan synthase alpha chain
MTPNRIEATFAKLRADGKRAFIPYIAAGDPSLEVTEQLILAFDAAGADVVELGVPFSDPIADGPSTERAGLRALQGGTCLDGIFRAIERIRASSDVPIVLMGYYNPFYQYGLDALCQAVRQSGADGVIITDLPPEDADELIPPARTNGIATIFLIAPTSTPQRMRLVADVSTGFIYGVSLTGVTGTRNVVSQDLEPMLKRFRAITDKPVCVGFGISNPEQARTVAELADGVIVGSAIVNVIEQHLSEPGRLVTATGAFVRELVSAVKSF